MFVTEGIRKGFLPSRGKRDMGERERVMERREREGGTGTGRGRGNRREGEGEGGEREGKEGVK